MPRLPDYVNWGAASQDLMDTAQVLELRAAIDALHRRHQPCDRRLHRARRPSSAHRGRRAHRIAARAADAVRAQARRLCGGAGALARAAAAAAQGGAGAAVRRRRRHAGRVWRARARSGGPAAALLDLPLPDAPWHGHSDRLAEVAAALGILDRHLRQDRARLSPDDADRGRRRPSSRQRGPGETSAMRAPARADRRQRRRSRGQPLRPISSPPSLPARCRSTNAESAAGRRSGTALPTLLLLTSGALGAIADIARGLEVDADRMRATSKRPPATILAEAVTVRAVAKDRPCTKRSRSSPRLAARPWPTSVICTTSCAKTPASIAAHAGELARLFELMGYQGTAQTFIDRQIGALQGRPASGSDQASKERHRHADDRRRRLPDPCRGRGPAEGAGADAVEFARHHAADVGPAGRGRSPSIFGWCVTTGAATASRACRKVPTQWSGSAATRSRCSTRLKHRTRQLVRPLDGRHGGPVARRQCARARRAARPRQHVELFSGQDRLERSPQVRAREGRRRACAGANMERWFTKGFREREPDDRRAHRARCSPPPRSKAISPAARRCATWTIANCWPKINAPTLVIIGRHDPGNDARGGRVHPPTTSPGRKRTDRCGASIQHRATHRFPTTALNFLTQH